MISWFTIALTSTKSGGSHGSLSVKCPPLYSVPFIAPCAKDNGYLHCAHQTPASWDAASGPSLYCARASDAGEIKKPFSERLTTRCSINGRANPKFEPR
jgi:hypothetical protein